MKANTMKRHAAATDEDLRWQAVLARDPAAGFVFGVRTTSVYCRPGCPARRPHRENVEFFDNAALAEAAGYRACKRCAPDGESPRQARHALVGKVCGLIAGSDGAMTTAALAAEAGLSLFHLHRLFKEVTGVTPRQYRLALRRSRLAAALGAADSVTQAVYDAGFNSAGRFYAGAESMLGMRPKTYRGGGAGEDIRYAVAECGLGAVMVAATQRGVCAIELGDSPSLLEASLRRRFPKAELSAGDAEFRRWLEAVLAYIELPRGMLELPLDVQGTVFQQRVWSALRAIPQGTTASYSELARRIGKPAAARAVAGACAANPAAVAIPCHRVIHADGSLSGYRWGIARKAELLRRESAE